MRTLIGWLLMLSVSLFWAQAQARPAADGIYNIIGEAYRLEQPDRLVYREKYTPVLDGKGLGIVDYFDPGGGLIATKTLDYRPGKNRPDFTMYDLRRNWFWSAEGQNGKLLLGKGPANRLEQKAVDLQEPQVVDAGFDVFIRDHLDQLKSGAELSFHSAVPARLNNYRLKAESIAYSQSPITRGDPEWCYIRVSVANPLISLFADALYLAYEADTHRLKVYRGRTGLPDTDGKPQDVEIYYHYY